MLDLIDELPEKEKVNNKLAMFIDKLGEAVHTDDTARAFLKELHVLKMTSSKWICLKPTKTLG